MTITSDTITSPGTSADPSSGASADIPGGALSSTPGADPASGDGQPVQPDQRESLGSLLEPPAGIPGEPPPIITAQVVTCDGQDIVLIGPAIDTGNGNGSAAGKVEVLTGAGLPVTRDRDTTASPVTDPVRRENLLRRTLSRLSARYRDSSTALRREQESQDDFRSQLREYVIGLLEDGDLGREQLDDFLDQFGLPAYSTAFRVSFTITGSYVVSDSTPEAIRSDARGYLRPDLTELDNLDDDDRDYTVTVNDVEQID